MSKKSKKAQKTIKSNVKALEALSSAGVAVIEALPGADTILKPLRRLSKSVGYTRLIGG